MMDSVSHDVTLYDGLYAPWDNVQPDFNFEDEAEVLLHDNWQQW